MSKGPQKYYLIPLPDTAFSTELNAFINEKLAYCLKKRLDNVILDLHQIEELQRIHLNIITRWLRNLKSLGGTLTLTGVSTSMLDLLRSSRISSACDVFSTLDDFKRKNAGAQIENDKSGPARQKDPAIASRKEENLPDEQASGTEIPPGKLKGQEPGEDRIREQPEPEAAEKVVADRIVEEPREEGSTGAEPRNEVLGESSEVGPQDTQRPEAGEEAGIDTDKNTESGELEVEEETGADTDDDEAESQGPKPADTEVEEKIEENKAEEEPHDGDFTRAENQEEIEYDPAEDKIKDAEPERGAESSPESPTLTEEDVAEIRETEGSITGSIDIRKLEQIGRETDVCDKLPFLKGEGPNTWDSEIGSLPGREESLVSDVDEEESEILGTDRDFRVETSGTYQCLSCGETEYFLKGSLFHTCSNSHCKGESEGWRPVVKLF
ncbi:hypothetical protein ACFL5V_03455 [Fibrobacterota bacterium]